MSRRLSHPLGAAACPGDALARPFRQDNAHLIIDHADFHRPQPQPRVALMLAGAKVELVAVPRADQVDAILRERKTQTGAVRSKAFLDPRDDLALADGSTHVRADILVGGEVAVAAEDADGHAVDLDDLAAGIGKGRHLTDDYFSHGVDVCLQLRLKVARLKVSRLKVARLKVARLQVVSASLRLAPAIPHRQIEEADV